MRSGNPESEACVSELAEGRQKLGQWTHLLAARNRAEGRQQHNSPPVPNVL